MKSILKCTLCIIFFSTVNFYARDVGAANKSTVDTIAKPKILFGDKCEKSSDCKNPFLGCRKFPFIGKRCC